MSATAAVERATPRPWIGLAEAEALARAEASFLSRWRPRPPLDALHLVGAVASPPQGHLLRLAGDGTLTGGVRFDPRDWPFPDASLHQVLIQHLVEAIEDPASLLAEAARVLRPGGRLLLLGMNPRGLASLSRLGASCRQARHWPAAARLRRWLCEAGLDRVTVIGLGLGWPWRQHLGAALLCPSVLAIEAHRDGYGATVSRVRAGPSPKVAPGMVSPSFRR